MGIGIFYSGKPGNRTIVGGRLSKSLATRGTTYITEFQDVKSCEITLFPLYK